MGANQAATLADTRNLIYLRWVWTRMKLSKVGQGEAAEFKQHNNAARRLLHRSGTPVILGVQADPIFQFSESPPLAGFPFVGLVFYVIGFPSDRVAGVA